MSDYKKSYYQKNKEKIKKRRNERYRETKILNGNGITRPRREETKIELLYFDNKDDFRQKMFDLIVQGKAIDILTRGVYDPKYHHQNDPTIFRFLKIWKDWDIEVEPCRLHILYKV